MLAIAAVVVLAAIVGLAGYVRSAARGESDPPAVSPATDDRAGPAAGAPAPRAPASSVAAPTGSRESATAPVERGAAPALPEAPLAEDQFLGDQGAPSPPPASGAARPPDPPREPTDPETPAADDPRDFDSTGQSQ